MKKIFSIFIVILFSILLSSCGSIVARKDKSQIVEFTNKDIKPDNYKILLYKLKYPDTPYEKDKFYEEFDILTSKMLVYKKDLNLIIPLEFYKDLKNLQKREVREGEKVFYKQAYSLTNEDKKIIDEKVKVDTPNNVGDTQIYLNKQVAYWYDYLKKSDEYESTRYYTELDKDRIVDEVFENRKLFSNISFLIDDNYALEIGENELEEIKELDFPIYLEKYYDSIEIEKLKSKIIIINDGSEDRVIPGKILLIVGKNVNNVKDYTFYTEVKEISSPLLLLSILDKENSLKVKELKNFSIKIVPNSTLDNATIEEEERERETLKFKEQNGKWGIE